ncbi:hypothetical protein [uncultured Helicobacter sp.]|uniref:hypothetical protein n=1 Tax=uncultured Helicobacter sp. TaxID=175537 RepID=UPI002622F032|nr:hypothetical protein [uncultured Helicobacter sp.]
MKKHTQPPYESSEMSYKPSNIDYLGGVKSLNIGNMSHFALASQNLFKSVMISLIPYYP